MSMGEGLCVTWLSMGEGLCVTWLSMEEGLVLPQVRMGEWLLCYTLGRYLVLQCHIHVYTGAWNAQGGGAGCCLTNLWECGRGPVILLHGGAGSYFRWACGSGFSAA